MTDLTLAVKLTADGRGLVGELRGGKAALDQLRATLGEAGRAASAMGADLAGLARQSTSAAQAERAAEQQRRADVRASAEAVQEAKRQEREARRQADAEAKAIRAAERARDLEAANAQRAAQAEFRRSQLAVRNLGFQISDVAQGLTLGVSPFLILAQQGGQVAQAMAEMQGAAGVAGRFLAGPFGVLVLSAVSVLGGLFLATRDAEQASNSHTDALDEQAEALKRLDEAGKKLIVTQERQNVLDLQASEVTRTNALEKRKQLASELEIAKQRAEQAQRDAAGDRGGRLALSGVAAGADADLAAVNRAIAENNKAITEANQRVRIGQSLVLKDRIAGIVDARAAEQQAFREREAQITELAKANKISLVEEAQLRLALERDIKAVKERASAPGPAGRAARSSGGQDRALAAEQAADLRFVDQLTAKYQPLLYLEQQRAEALERIKAAQARGAISQSAAAEFAVNINRDADQAKLKLLGDEAFRLIDAAGLAGEAAGAAASGSIARAVSASDEAASQFLRTWDAAREQVQGSLAETIDDLLAGKTGSIGNFWESFVAIGRRSIAETLTALIFNPQQGVSIPGIAGGGVTLGRAGATGLLDDFFSSPGSPFSTLTRGIEDLTAALGFGGRATLGKAGVDALDALGLAGGGGAAGGIGGGLLGGAGGLAGVLQGAGLGGAAAGLGGLFGLKTSNTGGAIGGLAGSFLPIPGGSLIGGLLGGILGGLFGSTKKSSVQIGTDDSGALVTGAQRTRGRSIDGALNLADGLFGSIQDIARQLNVDLRSGVQLGSIGTRNDRFVFDPTGANRTRGSGVEKFKTAEEASRAALSNAISKGVFDASDAVTRALKAFGEDIDRAVREALSVQSLEAEIANLRDPLNAGLREFERTEKERLRLAKDYGVDLVEVEKLNARDRQKIVEESLRSAVGPLQDLLTDIGQGSYADGSPAERLARLRADQQRLAGLAPGDAQAASELADVSRQLLDLSRELFGTTDSFASERAATERLLQSLVDQASTGIGNDPAAVGAAVGAAINGVLGGLPAATQENTGVLNEAVSVLQSGFASVVNALQINSGAGGGVRADVRLANLS